LIPVDNQEDAMRRALLCALLVCGAGCETSDIGAPCDLTTLEQPTTAASIRLRWTALECETRLCVGNGQSAGQCTDLCDSDSDCQGPAGACPEGFSCETPMVTGIYAGEPMCVCRSFLPR
jgi:hypothetical protein